VISSSFKHDRLDQAARPAAYADRCLAVLRTELADVGIVRPVGRIGVDGGTRFLDVWFDNIFTDLAVRDRGPLVAPGPRRQAHRRKRARRRRCC